MGLSKRRIILLTGFATFFFGFGAGAIYHWYLIQINGPLVQNLKASLDYKSAIFGDGILLPVVNMVMASFLLKHKNLLTNRIKGLGLFGGSLITAYFHIKQALDGAVNWAMPAPWQWNLLGLWHAIYMFAVATLISVFLATSFIVINKNKRVPWEFVISILGIFLFLIILRLDYIDIKLF